MTKGLRLRIDEPLLRAFLCIPNEQVDIVVMHSQHLSLDEASIVELIKRWQAVHPGLLIQQLDLNKAKVVTA